MHLVQTAASDVTGTVFRDSNPVDSSSVQFDYAIGEIYGGHSRLLINTLCAVCTS